MGNQQNYLGTIESSLSSNLEIRLANDISNMRKRVYKPKPTLLSCQYKPELYRKSMVKYDAYRHKLCICLLLVVKFYFKHVGKASFDFRQVEKFSTTNLHGVFSGGFKLVDRVEPRTGKVIPLKNAKSNNYSEEVNFIIEEFLILVEKASLHNGPAIWKFKELDLDDVILVELRSLIEDYDVVLDGLITKFHNARFEKETDIIVDCVNESDLDFLVEVIQIWMRC